MDPISIYSPITIAIAIATTTASSSAASSPSVNILKALKPFVRTCKVRKSWAQRDFPAPGHRFPRNFPPFSLVRHQRLHSCIDNISFFFSTLDAGGNFCAERKQTRGWVFSRPVHFPSFSGQICAAKFTQLLKNYAGFSSSSSRFGFWFRFWFRASLPAAGKHGPNLTKTPVQEPGIIQFMKLKVWQGGVGWKTQPAVCANLA